MPDTQHEPGAAAGGVDLTNCDREQIHVPGRVQSFGCLIAVTSDWVVLQASENVSDHLGLDPGDLVGTSLKDRLDDRVIRQFRDKINMIGRDDHVARIFACPVLGDARVFDVAIYPSGRSVVFEFEEKADAARRDEFSTVQSLIARVQRKTSADAAAQEAAAGLRALTGIDRVLVYRFEPDGSGVVVAEAKDRGMESFLGLHYPASDIPRQARALYRRNLIRMIRDTEDPGSPVRPERDADGKPLDLSLSTIRSVSPIHLEYLRNMGVRASMSVSIMRGGELWGLLACHHGQTLELDFERRTAVELFGQLFSYELARIEAETDLVEAERARELHDALIMQMSTGLDLVTGLDWIARRIADVIPFDGIALYTDGVYRCQGTALTQEEFETLARFLNTASASTVFASNHLSARLPTAEVFRDRVSGILALPISRAPRDYIVLFRREVTQFVQWAGNPEKAVTTGPNGDRLSPRKSFEAWQEVVRGTSLRWSEAEIRAANALRITLLEVVLKLTDEANAARQKAQEQQELLIAELNHRVRNILNLIRGLVSQGRQGAEDVEAYCAVLDNRIHALARAHDQLTQQGWQWSSVKSLISVEFDAFVGSRSSRMSIEGPDVILSPTAFTSVALVIHELVTNAAKYGALVDGSGSVEIALRLDASGGLNLLWREIGGPPVQAPNRRGFGIKIIENAIPFELKGRAEMRFAVTGLEADFFIPATLVKRAKGGAPIREVEATTGPDNVTFPPGDILVVEDSMIIAMEAADDLRTLGAGEVHTASSVDHALTVLDKEAIGFVLLDVNLGDETSLAVARRCVERETPFILTTGYGSSATVVASYPPTEVLRKPYTLEELAKACVAVLPETAPALTES